MSIVWFMMWALLLVCSLVIINEAVATVAAVVVVCGGCAALHTYNMRARLIASCVARVHTTTKTIGGCACDVVPWCAYGAP